MKRPLSTKFISQLIVTGILCVVFFGLILKDLLTEMMFIAWLAGLLANFGIYTTGNVQSKKYRPPDASP